jgi:cardiolipin synthase
MSRSLLVLPDDTPRPILTAINRAGRTLQVKMFMFSDPRLLTAVVAAKRRGVKVRVILNGARRDGQHDNDHTAKALERTGIEVREGNPAFDVTHEKSLVIDGQTAFVQSLNWVWKNLQETRDYAVVTTRERDVAEISDCFEADWHRRAFTPDEASHLLWCPSYARDRLSRFIDGAKQQLIIQNERFQDMVLIESLVRAAKRGVKVHVMTRPPHTLKKDKLVEGVGGLRILGDVGVKIHRLKHLKLHGKVLLADTTSAIVGSLNFANGSFDGRRELSIEVREHDVVDRLHRVLHHDWEHSHPLDLSDEGLFADLQDRIEGGAELLGLKHAAEDAQS